MNRRDFFKKSFLSLGAFFIVAKGMASVVLKALPGKLGYQEVSRFPLKKCENCKSYKADSGECVLQAMKNAMKADVVLVAPEAHCNMWAKIS